MTAVPYLYVNVIALCCYAVMLTAFVAAKKTRENKAFMAVLGGFILWAGGSVLMRLQVFPGVVFWYYVSLLALFSLPLLLYWFVCSFGGVINKKLNILWTAGTLVVMAIAPTGVFLQPPTVQHLQDGSTVFLYDMHWTVAIPCVLFLAIVLSIVKTIYGLYAKGGLSTSGQGAILAGFVLFAAGNLVQIIPGNIFPYDTLAGIVLAACMMYALFLKRTFRMRLLVSRWVLFAFSLAVCFILALYFAAPLAGAMKTALGMQESLALAITITLFAVFCGLAYLAIRRLVSSVLTKDTQYNRMLKRFSQQVSRTLNSSEVADKLVSVLRRRLGVRHVYVLLKDKAGYSIKGQSVAGDDLPAALQAAGCISYLESTDAPGIDVAAWHTGNEAELGQLADRKLLTKRDIHYVLALRSEAELAGLVVLPSEGRKKPYSVGEMDYLHTVGTIASIAMGNAMLYERIYREARIDSLTGVYSFKYFVERTKEEFEANRDDKLALVYLDIDDMKLYNQLYGTDEGDYVLKKVADIIQGAVQDKGVVFRSSGKVFAILLPGFGASRAYRLAETVQRQVRALNSGAAGDTAKTITLSGGICVAPQGADSPQALMEHADIAVFNAKNSGKGRINIFTVVTEASHQVTERVMQIIERAENKNDSFYSAYSATVLALTAAIDAKDHYTYTHSQNVAYYACMLAAAAGLNDEQVRLVYEAGLLHDIGKISIPESILCKTSKLDEEERRTMNTHVNNSIEMIRHLPSMDYVIPAAIGHHERWDGGGYPRGLKGTEIPVSARCLGIADAFDAMTSNRPYRDKRTLEYAVKELRANRGAQFDPELTDIFLELIKKGELTVRVPYTAVEATTA